MVDPQKVPSLGLLRHLQPEPVGPQEEKPDPHVPVANALSEEVELELEDKAKPELVFVMVVVDVLLVVLDVLLDVEEDGVDGCLVVVVEEVEHG